MQWGLVFGVSAGYAIAFCLAFSVVIVGGVLLARDSMVHAYPQAIRQRYGEKSQRGQRVAALMGVANAVLFVGTPVLAMRHLGALTGAELGFWPGFLFGIVLMFALLSFDLLVLDWWLFCTVQPWFFVLPGTEGMLEYRDYAFHWRAMFPHRVPWQLLLLPGYGVLVGGATLLAEALW